MTVQLSMYSLKEMNEFCREFLNMMSKDFTAGTSMLISKQYSGIGYLFLKKQNSSEFKVSLYSLCFLPRHTQNVFDWYCISLLTAIGFCGIFSFIGANVCGLSTFCWFVEDVN